MLGKQWDEKQSEALACKDGYRGRDMDTCVDVRG